MVLQSSSEVPLENPRQNCLEWLEDIGAILLDMMGTYYGKRPIVRDRQFQEPVLGPDGAPIIDMMTGQMKTKQVIHRVSEDFDFRQFKHLWFNISVNTGSTTYYSEIAMVQTLDNLRRDGTLEVIDYLERIPDKLIPSKQELIDAIKERQAAQNQEQAMLAQQAANVKAGTQSPNLAKGDALKKGKALTAMGGPLDSAKAVAQMPTSIQNKFADLPASARSALLKQANLNG